MSRKKKPQEKSCKRLKITLKIKREMIDKRERGVSVADLARIYNRSTSTICTILKNKDKIKEVDASKGVTRISAQRLPVLDDVERLLLIWINEKQLQADTINESIICEKAKLIFADLVKTTPGSSTAGGEVFKASHGWFEKFKRRTDFHSIMRHGKEASSDAKAAKNFIADFKKLIDCEGYLPQQVFNCDEMGVLWKKMLKQTYVTTEGNVLLGHKPMKDPLMLLFRANTNISQKEDAKESLSVYDKEVAGKQQFSGEIRKILKAWETVASYIEKHHPNKEVAMRATNLFNDNVMSHFYQILKHLCKQMSPDGFLVKKN